MRYVSGNPLRFVDPTGLQSTPPIYNTSLVDPGYGGGFGGPPVGGGLAGGVWLSRIFAPEPYPVRSLGNPGSLRGATISDIEKLIPESWTKAPLRKGLGFRYNCPNGSDAVFIEEGWSKWTDPVHEGPYVRVSIKGTRSDAIPLSGNPALK